LGEWFTENTSSTLRRWVKYNNTITSRVDYNQQLQTQYPVTITRTKGGTRVPNYRTLIRKHRQATTRFEASKVSYNGGQGSAFIEFYRNFYDGVSNKPRLNGAYCNGHILRPGKPALWTFGSDSDNVAATKFYKDLQRAQTAFQGGVALGELKETLRMLRNPAQGIRRGLNRYLDHVKKRVNSAKRRRPRRDTVGNLANRRAQIVSDTWLEHVYGWSPGISDIYQAGEALNRKLDRYDFIYDIVEGRGSEDRSSTSGWLDSGFNSQNYAHKFEYQYADVHKTTTRYKAEVCIEPATSVRANMRLFGTDWRDLVPTAWELIPYSFLADYFSNIGDVLSAWAVQRRNLTWRVRTVRNYVQRRVVAKRQIPLVTTYPGYLASHGYESSFSCSHPSIYVSTVFRDGSIPSVPDFSFEIPGFGRKWANIGALALSRNSVRRSIFLPSSRS
jgi:hypothetical protein